MLIEFSNNHPIRIAAALLPTIVPKLDCGSRSDRTQVVRYRPDFNPRVGSKDFKAAVVGAVVEDRIVCYKRVIMAEKEAEHPRVVPAQCVEVNSH
jgi:hypothetical protein